jgi:hypothetical protein
MGKRVAMMGASLVLAMASAVATFGACNQQADCPAKGAIVPNAACPGDGLQCPYDLQTPSPACDGTTTTLASSCTCTDQGWSCPSPVSCGGEDAGDDSPASSSEDAGEDSPGDAPSSG